MVMMMMAFLFVRLQQHRERLLEARHLVWREGKRRMQHQVSGRAYTMTKMVMVVMTTTTTTTTTTTMMMMMMMMMMMTTDLEGERVEALLALDEPVPQVELGRHARVHHRHLGRLLALLQLVQRPLPTAPDSQNTGSQVQTLSGGHLASFSRFFTRRIFNSAPR
jgi:hypothetical protein